MNPSAEKAQSRGGKGTSDATTFYPNAFHAASGQEEVVLLFGQCEPAPAGQSEKRLEFQQRVVLNPFAAKRFAMQLQDAVKAYELTYGPLDEESLAAEPTAFHGSGIMDERARRLLNLVEKLEVVYGLEYSFKILEKTLLGNRFLVTMTKDSIKRQTNLRLLDICGQTGMPNNFQDIYRENLSFAKYIHFGFEENEKSSIYKAYLEFPRKWELEFQNKPAGDDAFTLYLGFKWDASENRKRALTRYTCYPLLSPEKIRDRLSNIYEGAHQGGSLKITEGILETALGRVGHDDVLYLEVSEDNNPRRSFDINLYRAKLHLEELYPYLSAICRHFSIPPQRFHAIYDPMRSKRFGHLSGGIDREGRDFLTVYYGVEGYRKGSHNHP